jgi:glycosyltransferase involved in cell wall biosynthesis
MDKKVLFLSYRLGYDALLYWDNILTSIQKEFNSFRVFTAWESLTTKNKLVATEEKLKGIRYYHNKNKLNQKLYYLPLPFFILDIIKYKPDLIILNEFNIVSFYTLFFKLFYKNTKFLLLVESDPGIGFIIHKKNTIRHIYRKYIVKNVDLVLTNNQLGKNYLTNYLELNSKKIRQAPYLTSCPDANSIHQIKNEVIKFLYVGQLVERKGLIYLLEALNLLPDKIKENIHFDIVGGGNLEFELKEYVESKNLSFIKFRGKLSFNKLSKYYYEADCFVLPTLHDYRALVGFEAMYYGCAIIDSIYDGARFEVVEEDQNGYIIDPKNIEEFKDAISKIATNKEQLDIFKENSLSKIKNFTHEKCNNNFIKIIKEVLNDI